mmetsp:Transcript_89596/g.240282  ORF Transcript_89596/g.240282 Transcript_89596/m.240282 type:complete len:305 (+) Transcript_89596:619-1533(+)
MQLAGSEVVGLREVPPLRHRADQPAAAGEHAVVDVRDIRGLHEDRLRFGCLSAHAEAVHTVQLRPLAGIPVAGDLVDLALLSARVVSVVAEDTFVLGVPPLGERELFRELEASRCRGAQHLLLGDVLGQLVGGYDHQTLLHEHLPHREEEQPHQIHVPPPHQRVCVEEPRDHPSMGEVPDASVEPAGPVLLQRLPALQDARGVDPVEDLTRVALDAVDVGGNVRIPLRQSLQAVQGGAHQVELLCSGQVHHRFRQGLAERKIAIPDNEGLVPYLQAPSYPRKFVCRGSCSTFCDGTAGSLLANC